MARATVNSPQDQWRAQQATPHKINGFHGYLLGRVCAPRRTRYPWKLVRRRNPWSGRYPWKHLRIGFHVGPVSTYTCCALAGTRGNMSLRTATETPARRRAGVSVAVVGLSDTRGNLHMFRRLPCGRRGNMHSPIALVRRGNPCNRAPVETDSP